MKRYIYTAIICVLTLCAHAQRLTRNYQNESLSRVLEDLNAATSDKTIYFIYDELEDFTVTSHFRDLNINDAIREVVGFYPMRVTYDRDKIFIECTQKEDAKVMGHVVDENGKPVEFANVSLHTVTGKQGDENASAYLNGGVSNENGDFVIPCKAQRITLKVSYVGYKTVTRNVSVGNIGTITLQPESYTVKGVEIKGEMPQYKMTQGGMTVDVQHSMLHDVGNADDLLSMMPLVEGSDGKFTVLAKGEPEIYINNKKVRNPSELKNLKSTDVKSVDVITSPGAKYNAEVNAVIRIKTLKPQGEGLSLTATSQTWVNNKWNNYDDLSLKYRIGGLEAFASVASDNSHYSSDMDLEQELHISDDLFKLTAWTPLRNSWVWMQYTAGVSYDINADHSIGVSYTAQKVFSQITKTDMSQRYLKNGEFYGDLDLNIDAHLQDRPKWELNTYYVGKVGKLGIDFNATVLKNETEDHINEFERSLQFGNRSITTENWDRSNMLAAKLVLSHPVWKGMLSAGSEITRTDNHGHNYNYEYIIPETDNKTEEDNIAAFAEYNMALGAWRFNAGLRYEHVSVEHLAFSITQPDACHDYNDWFPNLSVAWNKGKWSAQLSYGKRISRPRYGWLTSAVVYDSRMLYEGGNPLLRPSHLQSIDLNITRSWLTFIAGFTHEHNFMTHIAKVYDAEKEIAIFMPENFDHQNRVYATLVASPKFGFWQPTATLHYYQQMFEADEYGTTRKLNKPEFSFDLKSWFQINDATKALLHINYTGSNHWGCMYRGSSFTVDARIQRSFLKNQLTATLYAGDIFRTARSKVITYYAIGQTAQNNYTYTQKVGLTLSYMFNASRSKYKGTGAGNAEKGRF